MQNHESHTTYKGFDIYSIQILVTSEAFKLRYKVVPILYFEKWPVFRTIRKGPVFRKDVVHFAFPRQGYSNDGPDRAG